MIRPSAPLTIALTMTAGLAAPAHAQCDVYRFGMPDFDQRRLGLPKRGSMYCMPTATANALAYLANHGYPAAFDGPRDWESPAHERDVDLELFFLGAEMGTDSDDGTNFNGWFDAMQPRALAVGGLNVSFYRTSGLQGLSPKVLSDQMHIGAVVLPVMGWYDDMGGGRWKRDGGHMVTMWGAYNTCGLPADMLLIYRDPANDRDPTAQGPFTTMLTFVEYSLGWTFARKNEADYFPRIVYRLTETGGFLDGFASIWPNFVLSTAPTLDSVTLSVPEPTTDQPGPRRFDARVPGGRLLAVAHGAIPTEGYLLAAFGGGRTGELSAINYVDGSVTPIGDVASPRGLVIGRDGIAYVASGDRIDRYGPTAAGGIGLIDSTPLPHQADALFFDDAADEIVALSQADRRLMRLTTAMTLRLNDALPPAAPVPGEASVAVNPIDGKEWIAGSGSATITRLGRDASGRLVPEALVTLPGVSNPRGLQFGDDGVLYVHEAGAIRAFVPDGAGGWSPDLANPLHDTQSGAVFTIGRGRSNFDPATMDDVNILPPDTGPGQRDCRADLDLDGALTIFDFLEFQNLFDTGSSWADFDYDGRLTIFDFLAYQNAFAAGC
ncbi:MAG: GC-type dockerin domain-anchored protein [Phycisphaerales bacterium]